MEDAIEDSVWVGFRFFPLFISFSFSIYFYFQYFVLPVQPVHLKRLVLAPVPIRCFLLRFPVVIPAANLNSAEVKTR